jgi:probable rRNA maturation factor
MSQRQSIETAFQNPNRYGGLALEQLRVWLEWLIAERAQAEGVEISSVVVRFVSDREMTELNSRFRGRDKTTDVLSFPALEQGDLTDLDGAHLGDIVISVPQFRRQARERGHSAERELKVLVLHGVLHCLGYDHETDQGEMERLERRLRRRLVDATLASGWKPKHVAGEPEPKDRS